ncbi:MAG: hypothetical protein ACRDTH_19855 [Pseudonocardiaceae bacterium]
MAVLAMIACVLVGALGFIGPRSPTSTIDRFIPDPWRLGYYGLLLLAGLIFLISVCLQDIRDRLIWERIALLFFAGVLLCYPVTIWAGHGNDPGSIYEGVVSCAFGFAGLWRIGEITLGLRQARRTIRRVETES